MRADLVSPMDAAARAALAGGKPLTYVSPPAAWALHSLLAAIPPRARPGVHTVVLVPETAHGADLLPVASTVEALRPVALATGQARTERLLRGGAVRTLIITPADALGLVHRAALKLDTADRVVVCWPETALATGQDEILDTLLAAAPAAQRLVVTTDDGATGSFLARHAHRAPVAVVARRAGRPGPGLRYTVVGRFPAAVAAVTDAMDTLNPERAVVWDPLEERAGAWHPVTDSGLVRVVDRPGTDQVPLAIASECPSPEVLDALRDVARDVLVLARPYQVSYLGRLADPLRVLPRTSEADRAGDRAHALRHGLRARLTAGGLDAELVALAPLFDEFDPALVAAAAAAAMDPRREDVTPEPAGGTPSWTRVRVNVGRRDRVGPGDVVGVLTNVVGVARDRIGRIDVRDRFCVLEVPPEEAETVLRGLTGVTIKGRRAAARLDAPSSGRP